jgi:hypothetical protein
MTDKTRFTLAQAVVTTAGVAGALALTACSGGAVTVSGRLDDTKWIPSERAVTAPATRNVPVYSRQCATKTRSVTTGTGKTRKTSNRSYQDCKNVRTGSRTESYVRTVKAAKPAMYCIELDDVNGHTNKDDQWYEVSWSTYSKWSGKDEGVAVKKMSYQRSLASCHR